MAMFCKIKIFGILAFFVHSVISVAVAQDINIKDINKFVGCVKIEHHNYHGEIIAPDRFVRDSIVQSPATLTPKCFLPADYNVVAGNRNYFRKANLQLRVLNVTSNKMLVVMQDIFGFERSDAVLSFWKIHGDSISLIKLHHQSILASIGSVSVVDELPLKDNSKLVLLKSAGGDGGDSWGKFYLFRWTLNDSLLPLFEKGYARSSGDTIQTELEYQLIGKENPKLRQISKTFRNELRKAEGSNAMIDVPVLFKSDTAYYEISTLPR